MKKSIKKYKISNIERKMKNLLDKTYNLNENTIFNIKK
jgi:hypothetical protein